jgi:hypothetical protein
MCITQFQTFRRVLDSEMKATHREGESIAEKRTRREKEAITDDEEGLLWSKGLLGDKTAQSLVYTIYFYIGKTFGLRAREHRQLRLSNFVIENNSDKDKEVQRRTVAEKFVLSNSAFTNCSFNILFLEISNTKSIVCVLLLV